MNIKFRLMIAAVAAGAFLLPVTVWSQETFTGQGDQMVLVTPDGMVLDFVPADADVIVRYNKNGRRVVTDSFGNVLATEMPMSRYRKKFGGDLFEDGNFSQPRQAAPLGESFGDDQQALSDDFFPEAPSGEVDQAPVTRRDLGEVTGSVVEIPGDGSDFQNQPMPQDEQQPGLDDNTGFGQEQSQTIQAPQKFPTISLKGKSRAEITAIQVFLDREGISPGVIDGKGGDNVSKAVDAWQTMTGETLDVTNTEDIMTRLGYSGGLPIISYTITSADAAGPYVAAIPEDYSKKAMLPAMSYTSVTEGLAERFHMDETYLKELNPGVDFTVPGSSIKVVNPGDNKQFMVSRIVADKARKQIFAYDSAGTLVASYPATIGSSDTPSPSGIHTVARVALNPNYTYNPRINFQQGENNKVLTIQPGPNTPVGNVWIALSKPTYGIHGTPEPSKIGKSQSHGCIRLTNWDATELARMVTPGVTVEFAD